MEVIGTLKVVGDTKEFGTNFFKKREIVITTEDQYPQMLPIEFVKDKCESVDSFKEGERVKVFINLRGREWITPDGSAKYFPSIQGWKIERYNG